MSYMKGVLKSRILKNHRTCPYCGSVLRSAYSLRRHVKEAVNHDPYRELLISLYERGAAPSIDGADPYLRISDGSGVQHPQLVQHEDRPPRDSNQTGIFPSPGTTGGQSCGRTTPLEPLQATAHHGSGQYQANVSFTDDGLKRGSMHDIQECPPEKKQLWESVGGMPVLLPKESIYPTGKRHTDEELFIQFLSADVSKVQIFADGIATHSPLEQRRTELLSLAYNHGKTALSDLPPGFRITAVTVLDRDPLFYVPRIDGDPVPQEAEDTEAIWVPAGGVTPTHIDNGKNVVSSPVHPCRRYFEMWPSTWYNLGLFDKCAREGSLESVFKPHAEGGLFAYLDEQALRMLAGTLHMVKTIVTGIIVTKAYIDERVLIPMSRWISACASWLERTDDEYKGIVLDNWVSSAWLATPEDIVKGWELAQNVIFSTLLVRPAAKKSLCALFNSLKKSSVDRCSREILKELKAK